MGFGKHLLAQKNVVKRNNLLRRACVCVCVSGKPLETKQEEKRGVFFLFFFIFFFFLVFFVFIYLLIFFFFSWAACANSLFWRMGNSIQSEDIPTTELCWRRQMYPIMGHERAEWLRYFTLHSGECRVPTYLEYLCKIKKKRVRQISARRSVLSYLLSRHIPLYPCHEAERIELRGSHSVRSCRYCLYLKFSCTMYRQVLYQLQAKPHVLIKSSWGHLGYQWDLL